MNAPTARGLHHAVWSGSEMIVFGGYGPDGVAIGHAAYNPATDSWRTLPTSAAPGGRAYHSCVWTGTERIVWGGYGGTDASPFANLNNGHAYRPDTNEWRTLAVNPATPGARLGPDSAWSGKRMLIFAGYQSGYFTGSVSSFFIPGRTGYYYIRN